MLVLAVDVHVKPENREQFIAATLENARGARTEPGNLRFDVSQSDEDPNRFVLYEVYCDAAGMEAHQKAPHYLKWRETVKDWMAVPRQRIRGHNLFPEAEKDW
jgi:autoinducer 2-degrading protein